MSDLLQQERAIFGAYINGASYSDLSEQYSVSPSSVFNAVRRIGGRGTKWGEIAKANREAATQDDISRIAGLAGQVFCLRPGLIWTPTRKRHVMRARQAAFLVARENGASFPAIGRAFEMDHSTVLHGCWQARNYAERVPHYARLVELLRNVAARKVSEGLAA